MRDPAANAIAAAEAKRVKDAIYKARTYLHWTVVHDQRWDGSRWSGQDPRLEREENFYYAVEVARKIINDPACDSLLFKHARVPGARKVIIAALEQVRQRPRKKGELRAQMNALRDERIADAVAQICKDGFSVHRGSVTKDRGRKESACSIVAQALRKLGFKLSEKTVETIWDKYKNRYRRLLSSDLTDA